MYCPIAVWSKNFQIGRYHLQFKCPYLNALCVRGYGHTKIIVAPIYHMVHILYKTILFGWILIKALDEYTTKYFIKS